MIATLIFASALATSAQGSGLFNAAALEQKCQSTVAADASYCFAYVVGVHDATRSYEAWLNLREFCTPPGIVQADLRRAFVEYMAENPGYRSGEAASVVIVALKKRYPCATRKPSPSPSATPRK